MVAPSRNLLSSPFTDPVMLLLVTCAKEVEATTSTRASNEMIFFMIFYFVFSAQIFQKIFSALVYCIKEL
jgi:hypothetical protein